MPISLSAKKSLRKSNTLAKSNSLFKEALKKIAKNFVKSPSAEGLKDVYSILDKAVKKNIYHKNKTARLKSEYSKKLADKDVKVVKVAKSTKKKQTAKKMSK